MNLDYVFFLGSNSTLSAAECYVTLRREGFAPRVLLAQRQFLVLRLSRSLPDNFINRLGGITRIGVLRGQQGQLWSAQELASLLSSPTSTKLRFGLSAVGVTGLALTKMGLAVKQSLRKQGVRARFIAAGKGTQLNSAQILFNRLHRAPNCELTFLRGADSYLLAETRQVQDIQAYEVRDTGRPMRDARVGMLPPKLAQIMLNLIPSFPTSPPTILDPFCGTGVILQEGWLLGYHMTGRDQSDRMIQASKANLDWLISRFGVDATLLPEISVHDAHRPFADRDRSSFDAIVTEPYLGAPLTALPPRKEAAARTRELVDLYIAFFRNAKLTLKEDAHVVFILPALREVSGWQLFPASFLDETEKLGYHLNHLVPKELALTYQVTDRGTVVYARPNALVGREIALLQKP
jgi:tRNA G10  N-methylase Trm11